MGALPFVLLLVALVIFLISTIQLRLWWRVLIWVVGALMLSASLLVATDGQIDQELAGVLADASANVTDPADSLMWQALWGNQRSVAGSLVPMLDVFLSLGFMLAFLALVALTPGRAVERLLRPLCWIVIGAVGGGVLALGIVAIGVGDDAKRRVYVGVVTEVHDGDTFSMGGEVNLRLDGVDAPELDQICFRREETVPCGEQAQERLERLVRNAIVVCGRRGIDPDERHEVGAPRETYSRPLVQCWARNDKGGEFDLAQRMASEGFAAPWGRRSGPYDDQIELARVSRRGIWSTCTLSPSVWRNVRRSAEVREFSDSHGSLANSEALIGQCASDP